MSKKRTEPSSVDKTTKKHKREEGKSFQEILKQTSISDAIHWMKEDKPIFVNKTDNAYNALQVLADNKIHSVPVWDELSKSYIGFIDQIDLVTAVANVIKLETTDVEKEKEKKGKEKKEKKSKGDDDDEEEREMEEELEFDMTSVLETIDVSKRDPFVEMTPSDTIADCLQLFSKGVHRVAVTSEGKLLGVVTQSGLIEYMLEEFAPEMNKLCSKAKVKDLKTPKEVLKIQNNKTALEAFQQMQKEKVSGLAVVNEAGALVDVISASDLMLWSEWITGGQSFRFRNFATLKMAIPNYLKDCRRQKEIPEKRIISCTPTSTVLSVIEEMLLQNVHRSFIVDKKGHPTSVVTYSELAAFLSCSP